MENVTSDVTMIWIASAVLLSAVPASAKAKRAIAWVGLALLVPALAFMASGRQIQLPISPGAADALSVMAIVLVCGLLFKNVLYLWRTWNEAGKAQG